MNHEADSVQQLRLLSARLNGDCHYVVVENQAHREHFRIYEDSKTRARIMGELRGREITMSRLARLARHGSERKQRHRERGDDASCLFAD
ncbi:MAG TPA: hypothetical protein VGD78_21235 [Chthoniobacterales bacterium]